MNGPAGRWERASQVLADNWVGSYTVPSRSLYPHQWSWDSAFVAIGLAHLDPARAHRELTTLFEAQWADGRVPHIVFNPRVPPGQYFPGPEVWTSGEIPGTPPVQTTGLVQPPVHGYAALRVYRCTGDRDFLVALYPKLVAYHRYLAEHRDVGGGGLAAIVHPWESGLDNSPAWDQALAAVAADPLVMSRYQRRDLQHAPAEERPTDGEYARYLTLVESYRAMGYADRALGLDHPFVVECPLFNAVFAASELALAEIALVVGARPDPHRQRAAALTEALLARLYDPAAGMFTALDVRAGTRGGARTVAGLTPLLLPGLPARVGETLLASLASARFGLPATSYDRAAPGFDRRRYWRGPVWVNVNWLLWRALLDRGERRLADRVRTGLLSLVERAGYYEYFDPLTGSGHGSGDFSWSAALTLDLLAAGRDPD